MAPTNKINKEVVESSKKFEAEQYIFKYGFKDTILYNLAVGASLENDDLRFWLMIFSCPFLITYHRRYLYEKHERFEPVQTMGTLPGIGFLEKVIKGDVPGLSVNLGNLLHAEHYIKIYRQVKLFFLQLLNLWILVIADGSLTKQICPVTPKYKLWDNSIVNLWICTEISLIAIMQALIRLLSEHLYSHIQGIPQKSVISVKTDRQTDGHTYLDCDSEPKMPKV